VRARCRKTGHHLLARDDDVLDHLLEVGEAGAHRRHDVLDGSASDPIGSAGMPTDEIRREQLIEADKSPRHHTASCWRSTTSFASIRRPPH
jgi:hypothetical protein